jgi:hypothetical protein
LTGHPAWWLESLCHGGLSKPSYSLGCHWLCYSLALVIEKCFLDWYILKKYRLIDILKSSIAVSFTTVNMPNPCEVAFHWLRMSTSGRHCLGPAC